MHSMQALMPVIAACALAAALLVPLRDGRSGRRATVYGRAAVTASFPPVARDPFDAAADVTDDVIHAAAHDAVVAPDSHVTPSAVKPQESDLHTSARAAPGSDAQPSLPSHRGLARFFDGRVSAFLATTLRGTIFDSGQRGSVRNTGLEMEAADDAQQLAEAIAAYRSSRDEDADDDARRFADAIAAYDPSHGDDGRRTGDDGDGSNADRGCDDGAHGGGDTRRSTDAIHVFDPPRIDPGDGLLDPSDARPTTGMISTTGETSIDDGRRSHDDTCARRITDTISTSREASTDEEAGAREREPEDSRNDGASAASSSIDAHPSHGRRERLMPPVASRNAASDEDAETISNPIERDSRAVDGGETARSASGVEREGRLVRSQRTWSVPPTRMPLRPIVIPEWPRLLPLPLTDASRESRHAVLARRFNAGDGAYEPALCAAFNEEDARGRILVLRALGGLRGHTSLAVLVGALNDGTDDERSAALDSLAMRGERDALATALTDRVDAIAARAALAFVDSEDRGDYERMLGPLVDRTRLDTLLGLLAAVLP